MIQAEESPLLTETEAASYLRLKVATLRRWRWAGIPELPFHKIGGRVRYSRHDLNDFIASARRTQTGDDVVAAS